MDAREEPDGSLVLTYDGVSLARWMGGIAAVLIATAVYDNFIGTPGTDRLLGLLAGAGTCMLAALALLEKSCFRFDPGSRTITWSRRWAFRRRSGIVPFHEVKRVSVEVPIGDEGIPSRRICLRLSDGSSIPLTVGYRPDHGDRIVHQAERVREILGQDPSPSPAVTAQALVEDGDGIGAVKLLVEKEGLSLGDAKRRVDEMKRPA